MTLIVGFRGVDGVVLASDSQATRGAMKQTRQKVFISGPLIWGAAGELAASQTLYTELEKRGDLTGADRETVKAAVRTAMLSTARELDPNTKKEGTWFEGLFGWYSKLDRRGFLLRARPNGYVEFEPRYTAVGSNRQLGEFGFFGFSRAEFLGYETLPLETVKMLTLMIAEDAVRASAQGVCLPIQMAVASESGTAILRGDELEAVNDTVAAYRMHQQDFLKRTEGPTTGRTTRGLVPRDRG